MKINKKLEKDFIRAIQKSSHERTKKEEKAITLRNEYIDSQFVWTPEVKQELLLINKRFREEEMRVFKQYRKLEKYCQAMVDNRDIEDFELEVEWSCWNETHYIKYDDSVDGNPFYSNDCVGDFMIHQREEDYDASCYNTLQHYFLDAVPIDPIVTEPHCYMFHHLYDHCDDLTWFDICNIDKVWIEIKVRYQFFSNI